MCNWHLMMCPFKQEKDQLFKLVEKRGFTKVVMATAPDISMAHCVSADLEMKGGITPAFKKLCHGFEELKKQGTGIFFKTVNENFLFCGYLVHPHFVISLF